MVPGKDSGPTPESSALSKGAVASLPEDVHHGLEGEPIGDVLAGTQASAELGARELDDLLARLLGHALRDVALILADVDHVLVVRHRHTELGGVLLAHLLRVIGAVEVVASDGAL
eukprot:CAMPEP_0183498728 /NCGR_PEP_ID=MMETSP0371-20130417/1062_1 /TAXON_ID=268820 /ORGANISM="Peridinium aciculiferum, Strain PAER-2" /LENGTH=114 /DNA_ID=CAMNT_0025692325 /DNA_START=72 /DNA_END=414 /DNA_ORIENTATION=-